MPRPMGMWGRTETPGAAAWVTAAGDHERICIHWDREMPVVVEDHLSSPFLGLVSQAGHIRGETRIELTARSTSACPARAFWTAERLRESM